MTVRPAARLHPGERNVEQFHHMLLRVDSRLPDELIVAARAWLGDGHLADVANAVAFAAMSSKLSLAAGDVALLVRTLGAAGEDTRALRELMVSDGEELPPYLLSPVGPDVLAEHGPEFPHTIDATDSSHGPGGADAVDAVAVAAVAGWAGTHGLWRSWRYPKARGEWPLAKRTYLVRLADGYDGGWLAATAARIQSRLVESGEMEPLVTVFADEQSLPDYHRYALRFSALLWTASPQPEIHVAQDCAASLDGPEMPKVGEPERSQVQAYLAAGTPLLITTEFTRDMLDPTHPAVVPTDIRTDGEWIWSDAAAYYLDRYGLAPDAPFLAHMRHRQYVPAAVDQVALHRTRAVVLRRVRATPSTQVG